MEIALQIIWQVIAACALIIAAVALHRNNKNTEDLETLRRIVRFDSEVDDLLKLHDMPTAQDRLEAQIKKVFESAYEGLSAIVGRKPEQKPADEPDANPAPESEQK